MPRIISRALAAGIAAALALAWGCGRDEAAGQHGHEHADGHEHGHHKAAHGGCLNAIGACETGHAEVALEDGLLRLWFVGGGNDTAKAVRVPDGKIALSVTLEGEKEPRALVLEARPSALLEEKAGDCSCFEARADWLTGVRGFKARGEVDFKGRKEALVIDYPHGYDPDHGEAGKEHGHGQGR